VSYPEPRYLGEGGEASAIHRPADHPPELTYPSGNAAHYLATGAHFHRTLAESFYILRGTIRIYDGRTWIDTVPGDFVHVPEGGIHGFRNESGEPAAMLIHFAPGAPREAYFEGTARIAAGRLSDEELADFYARHDNIWVEEAR
jgi:mannose-6-phosphate isomerase-like protein (cupin superfamily)